MNSTLLATDARPANMVPLDAYRMPFTANRQFKADPRLLVSGEGHALLRA